MPYRAEEAGKVFAMSYAREVSVSRPESPGANSKTRNPLAGEEEYAREVLVHQDVPDVGTEQELEEMARVGKTNVTIVTSRNTRQRSVEEVCGKQSKCGRSRGRTKLVGK
jgi:hypothetical protein